MGMFPNMMGMDQINMGSPLGPNQPFQPDFSNMQYFQNMYQNNPQNNSNQQE